MTFYNKEVNDILNKDIISLVVKYSPPAIIDMMLYSINNIINIIIISHLIGKEELSIFSISIPITQTFIGLGSLIGSGTGILYSNAIGANNFSAKNILWPNLVFITIIFSITISLLIYSFSDGILYFYGISDKTFISKGSFYLKILSLGSVFSIYNIASNMLLRSEGKLKQSMFLSFIGVLFNITFQFYFVSFRNLGLKGSAYAIIFSEVIICVFITFYLLFVDSHFSKRKNFFQISIKVIADVLKDGFSTFAVWTFTIIQSFVIIKIITDMSSIYEVSFYSVLSRISSLASAPVYGITRALQPILGLNFGAGNFSRLKKCFYVFFAASQILIIIILISLFLFKKLIINYLIPNHIITIDDMNNFRIFILNLLLLPFLLCLLTYFQSTRKLYYTNWLILNRYIIIYIPALLIFLKFYGLMSVYIVQTVVDMLIGVIGAYFYLKEDKLNTHSKFKFFL